MFKSRKLRRITEPSESFYDGINGSSIKKTSAEGMEMKATKPKAIHLILQDSRPSGIFYYILDNFIFLNSREVIRSCCVSFLEPSNKGILEFFWFSRLEV